LAIRLIDLFGLNKLKNKNKKLPEIGFELQTSRFQSERVKPLDHGKVITLQAEENHIILN
jgi:hypothetical protein